MMSRKHGLKLTFAHKIMISTSVIVLIVALLVSTLSWHLSAKIFDQMEQDLLQRNVDNTYKQLNTSLDTALNLSTQLVYSDELSYFRTHSESFENVDSIYSEKLIDTMNTLVASTNASIASSIQFIGIYMENGFVCSSTPIKYLPYRNYNDCLNAIVASGVSNLDSYIPACWVEDITLQGGSYTRCLVGMRFIYEDLTLDKIGVLVIGIKQSSMEHIFSTLPTDAYLVRTDGRIISSSKRSTIGQDFSSMDSLLTHMGTSTPHLTTLPDGNNAFIYRVMGGSSWFIYPLDESLLHNGTLITKYSQQVTLVTGGAVILALLFGWICSKGLTKSLVRLKSTVQKIYEGDHSARFTTDQQDEIAYVGKQVNDMMDQINLSVQKQEQDAAEKRKLELLLMRAQINPHLLYNTLNSALWIIRQHDFEKAEKLILSLGNFFKLALSKGNDEISLSNEISMIQHYLKIQNLGRGKTFSLVDTVPEELRNCKLLRLTLQTLVENSVIHGFSDWRDDGEIVISAKKLANDSIQISVTDNGIGILEEDMITLLEEINTYPPKSEKKHYGLYNVNRRIKNKYGKDFGLTIESEVGAYTTITLILPLYKENTDD